MVNLMSAKDLKTKLEEAQAAKATAAVRAQYAAEAEKQALLEQLLKPSGLSDDAVIEKASIMINRAVEDGMTSVRVFQFPHHLCTDNGRAINQAEVGWERTLAGVPREIYEFWQRCLQPLGYRIRYEVIDYPGGKPGNIGITLSWDVA
jgi:hypothetical protein